MESNPQPKNNSDTNKKQVEDHVVDFQNNDGKEDAPQGSCKYFILSWVLMVVAGLLYVGIFFLSHKVTKTQWSSFYTNYHEVSPYYAAEANQSACNPVLIENSRQVLYPEDDFRTNKSIAMSIIFSWIMWKLPLSMYTLSLAWANQNKIIKFVSWGVSVGILLALDILLTAFIPSKYYQVMFFGFNTVMAIIVSAINNRNNLKKALAAAFFPMLFIGACYFLYTNVWPFLFQKYGDKFPNAAVYMQVYIYLLWDLLLYSLLLVINKFIPDIAKPFTATIQFLLLGYFVGMTLLVGVTEVQFYYLVGYMLFRNFFTNWVMWKWEGITNNPPCLAVWIIPYYLSYAFNFLPIIEMGSIIVSKSFYSQEFSQACMILSYFPTSEYPYNTETPAWSYNTKMRGYILWVGALIIWVISTASQKYPRRKPTPFDFFFNLFGIYMFYVGISAGLQLPVLAQKNIF